MTLVFADGTRIQTRGNPTEFLFRNRRDKLNEWLDHLEAFNNEMRFLDAFLKRKEVSHGH